MEHYQIIQALCRTALSTGGPAARQQVERLRDSVRESGDNSVAQSLDQLLSRAARASEMAPSKLTQSRQVRVCGEELSRNTPVPVDRETSSPLADILFAEALPLSMPLFDAALTTAAQSLVQEWRHVESLNAVGVDPSSSCLIYGPPGTGKTTLALWLARELNVPAVVARLDGLISSFLGTTARNVGNLFAFANRYRCVLVLDEFDAVAKVRDDPHEVGEIKRVVNALLQNIDARRRLGITVAVTNHEGLLDPAIWRRFEIQLNVPKPGVEGRIAIIRLHLPPIEIGDAAERLIAWLTDGLSGAEVETVVKGLKKHYAVSGRETSGLIDVLQHLVVLNGSRMNADRTCVLEMEPQAIAQRMVKDEFLNFTQAEVGQILSRDKTTISRWLRAA
jgi:MoxR-like ATPase